MLGLYVSVPIACFRRGRAREYLETELLPPPSMCYGFFLSLVGETDRENHIGCRVSPSIVFSLNPDEMPGQFTSDLSVVLRTVWRVKSKPLGSAGNTRPDYQQLLSNIHLVIWLDSSGETCERTLEQRVQEALTSPGNIQRFGGLSLGESTHLVDEVVEIERWLARQKHPVSARRFELDPKGNLSLPVWVDHVGSQGTRYVRGSLIPGSIQTPESGRMPQISPENDSTVSQ
ncbi:type I-MYXAN CRISPR-associated protein Cas5/Cmx5/DevS [Rubinisphaera margarita]|uniref:type I-MYXAN CRISPR-associated protein Cas5/Cmx5/DevS n=1 Tax=Rubinisphaera margarita TaxID=2909586 RepID=UPI001EE88886|nr:type I-MYXAN CRISPR-associated protein Cas5/Cmx5/DevS [Rubinisphaera margarita]MCG6157256.1 type I-MYXAN CRISPR-associated protein Cas5/Cmx5/DevS [Rubinisphaera margarita]